MPTSGLPVHRLQSAAQSESDCQPGALGCTTTSFFFWPRPTNWQSQSKCFPSAKYVKTRAISVKSQFHTMCPVLLSSAYDQPPTVRSRSALMTVAAVGEETSWRYRLNHHHAGFPVITLTSTELAPCFLSAQFGLRTGSYSLLDPWRMEYMQRTTWFPGWNHVEMYWEYTDGYRLRRTVAYYNVFVVSQKTAQSVMISTIYLMVHFMEKWINK